MDPSFYTYPSPLAPLSNASINSSLPPLSSEKNPDGNGLLNSGESQAPDAIVRDGKKVSKSYEAFTEPLDSSGPAGVGGFDVHIYYFQRNEFQTLFAKELYERIRREFPELRIYTFFDRPIGPHPIAMFEVNVFTPAQFGAFIPWLVINRGPLSCLIHPNCVDREGRYIDVERDHTQRATWMGERLPLDLSLFKAKKAST